MSIELHAKAKDFLHSKYNILLELDCRDFDFDYNLLISLLDKINKPCFEQNERILLVHMDTDYYDQLLPFGLIPINIIRIFKNLGIPLFTLLFMTNHYGIHNEFDSLLSDHDCNDRPTIIETLLSKALLTDNLQIDCNLNFDEIEKQGLCMMGIKRSHRLALANFIKNNNLLENIALQTNFK